MIDGEDVLTSEMDELADVGLQALSTTLLVRGEPVSVYRGTGYLLEGTR